MSSLLCPDSLRHGLSNLFAHGSHRCADSFLVGSIFHSGCLLITGGFAHDIGAEEARNDIDVRRKYIALVPLSREGFEAVEELVVRHHLVDCSQVGDDQVRDAD